MENYEGAEVLAKRAVAASPLSQPAVRTLAETDIARAQVTEAKRKIGLAANLGWRDVKAQARLMQFSVEDNDLEGALARYDAIQRRAGVSQETQQIAALLLSDTRSADMLLDLLEQKPGWRGEMFARSDLLQPDQVLAFAEALASLQARNVEIADSELFPVLDRLSEVGNQDAFAEYSRKLYPQAIGNGLTDGQFAAFARSGSGERDRAAAGPFGWKRGDAKRTVVSTAPQTDISGSALRISTRSRLPSTLLFQRLILSPGDYTMSYRFRPERVGEQGGLSWFVRCAGSPGQIEARLPAGDPDDWQDGTLDFTVPANACRVQLLGINVGRNLSGNAIVGNFAEVRLSQR